MYRYRVYRGVFLFVSVFQFQKHCTALHYRCQEQTNKWHNERLRMTTERMNMVTMNGRQQLALSAIVQICTVVRDERDQNNCQRGANQHEDNKRE